MASVEETLISELMHNANASGQRPLEQRLADLSVWFYKNYKHIPKDNLAARCSFLERSIWCLIEIQALMLERQRETAGSKGLWLPRGVTVSGAEYG